MMVMNKKMMICYYVIVWLMFNLITVNAISQDKTSVLSKLNIGDQVPVYTFKNLINYAESDPKITDFKGKILILDFWSFGCTACVASWPKLMELQQEFKEQIQIVLVNVYEDKEKVKAFIKNHEKSSGYKMTLPISCGDSELKLLFPHQLVPHVVFIDQNGLVKYITESLYLNKEVLKNILNKKEMIIPLKTDEYPNIQRAKPLFINGNVADQERGAGVVWSSVINPYSANILSVSTFGRSKGRSYGWIANHAIKDALRILYGKGKNALTAIPNSLVQFKHIDSSEFVKKIDDVFQPNNCFTIQVTAERELTLDQIKRKMISDLELCFGISTGWIKEKKQCLVLSRSNYDLATFKSGQTSLSVSRHAVNLNGVSVEELIDHLSIGIFSRTNLPIVDETNFNGRLGIIRFKGDELNDYKTMSQFLTKYGLMLSVQEREVKMLTIEPGN